MVLTRAVRTGVTCVSADSDLVQAVWSRAMSIRTASARTEVRVCRCATRVPSAEADSGRKIGGLSARLKSCPDTSPRNPSLRAACDADSEKEIDGLDAGLKASS